MNGCPNCGNPGSHAIHRVSGVPVNSCLLFSEPGAAQRLPRGDIDLAFCPRCAFVFNASWRNGATIYTDRYEETQAFSPTYVAFQRRLAEDLIGRYDIRGKEIVEIGCGKGAFLALLCETGGNSGIGYDPSFVPERGARTARVEFRREYFSEDTEQAAVDLVCCRMTLEHIAETRRFLGAVRRIASPERGTVAFFQVPDVRRILQEGAFWDVYYEHCSYFSSSSLEYLFRTTGFDVLRMQRGYDDQYLTIEARASGDTAGSGLPLANSDKVEDLARDAAAFSEVAARRAADWASLIRATADAGGRVALWGSGSKAVAFLSAVDAGEEVDQLIDVNPHRWDRFVPGSGKRIAAPAELSRSRPDLVIAMNPIYRREIATDLVRYGCGDALLCALGDEPIEPVPAGTLAVAAPTAELRRPAFSSSAGG